MKNLYVQAFFDFDDFYGKSKRKEFILFNIVNVLICTVLWFVSKKTFPEMITTVEVSYINSFILIITAGLYAFFSFIIFVPTVSMTVRRLRDAKLSVWWLLFIVALECFGKNIPNLYSTYLKLERYAYIIPSEYNAGMANVAYAKAAFLMVPYFIFFMVLSIVPSRR